MDLLTHFLLGMVFYSTFFSETGIDLVYFAGFFAILPDLDVFITRPFQHLFNFKYLEHRGASHSYIIGIGVSLLFSGIYSPISRFHFFYIWLIGILSYGLHISMDLLTTTEIPLLYPLSRKELSFYVEKAGSGFTMIISLLILSILIPLDLSGNNQEFIFGSYITLGFFTGYYLYRIILKIIVSMMLLPKQKYFPGILPIYYYIYTFDISTQNIRTKMEKFTIFRKTWLLFDVEKNLEDYEYRMYFQALKICNSDYYSNKWTKAPFITKNDNHVIVKLSVLETMMNGRTISQSYEFNAIDHQLTNHYQQYLKITNNKE